MHQGFYLYPYEHSEKINTCEYKYKYNDVILFVKFISERHVSLYTRAVYLPVDPLRFRSGEIGLFFDKTATYPYTQKVFISYRPYAHVITRALQPSD